MKTTALPLESIQISAYTIPTDFPESDGTIEWSSTTLVLVETKGSGKTGLGFTYADTAPLIQDRLVCIVLGRDALAITDSWSAMVVAIRNLGRPGICSKARDHTSGVILPNILGRSRDIGKISP